MAGSITTNMCSSFKQELMEAVHNFSSSGGNTFKVLLLSGSEAGTYDSTVTNVGTPGSGTPSSSNVGTDEVSGTGYTSGGATLTNSGVSLSGTTAFTSFGNPSWSSASFTTSGCVIYNSTESGKTCGVFSFGGNQTVTNGTFTILMPTANSTSAILRLQ